MSELPSQRIDRSRKEARWFNMTDGTACAEWYTDGKFVNFYCKVCTPGHETHVNNWFSKDQLKEILSTMGDGARKPIEPDGVNIIEIDMCQVNDIGQAFGQSTDGVFHGFTKAPPGAYRVLLERIGD